MHALILDGHLTKSALSCVRSLGKQGVSITCGAQRKTGPACHSKYVQHSFVYVSPKDDQEKFIADVIQQATLIQDKEGERPVLFCFSDATALTLSRARSRIEEYVLFPLPSEMSIEIAADKLQTYEQAQKLSVPVIQTFEEDAFDFLNYPVVVKNRHSVAWENGKSVSGTAQFVFGKEALAKQYADIADRSGEQPLVMKFIKGEEYGIELMCNKGEVLAEFAHKRIRSLSPRGGAAVVKETAQECEEVSMMRTYAHALVKELAWHGPVMVEFKVDAQDGRVLLMEINGRFWGSLPLAVSAGVDFPMLYYRLAQGEDVETQTELQPARIRTRHFLGDCKWLLSVLFAKDPMRKYLYPSRLRALWDFKTEIFRSKGDVFAWNDPLPSLYEYVDIVSKGRHS